MFSKGKYVFILKYINMIKRLLIVLCLMFFLPFYCFAVLTEKEEVHFETNLWVYAPLYYGADTNTYIGFTSSTQIVFRLDGSNTYFNKVWEDTEEDNILTDNLNADDFSITNAGTFQGSNFVLRSGVDLDLAPKFRCYRSADQYFTNAVTTKIDWDTELYDTGGGMDIVTNRYTPPYNGVYYFHASIRIEGISAAGKVMNLYFTKEGGAYDCMYTWSSAAGDQSLHVSMQLYLTTSQYIEVYFIQLDTATKIQKGGAIYTVFEGHYIGN